ncbi:MAG: retroviral-like aspartic protease family protein [Candidatus Rokubacteria bacterium]|nr:retroviral-like aspartic protease family protein [Candidatus Rokubacteria bacterium]
MQVSWAGFVLLLITLLPAAAWAQMYQWEDEQGTVHYTNELQSVPEPYRSGARFVPASPMAPPAVAPAQGITRIPFTPGSPILVSARINGAGPVTLILDTGADRTLLTPMALWRLGISTAGAPRAEIKGVTGTAQGELVQVNSVEVGEAKAGPLLILVHDADLKQAEGLLGRDFLERFTVTIDASERVVTLAPR